jgi:uncharacterized protein
MKSMLTLHNIRQKLRKHLPELRGRYDVRSLEIFGSFTRDRQHRRSDIDLLVEFEESSDLTLLQFLALERELGQILGRKVDLVEKGTLKPAIGRRIVAEAIPV